GSPQIVHGFDPEVIDLYLSPIRAQYEAEPVDARFQISGNTIVIIPGKRGTRIDETETATKLLQAGQTGSRLGQLPLVEDADPDVTTQELEDLGIKHLVSSFTTYHSCCQDRVINIQLMADTIDEHIVMPGGEFSINGFVGQRTAEKGYVPAGTIVAGELVDTVGGGVSQFATTMYNAIFWAGLQDIDHKPHSYYFSRYPEGIEATVNWQTPQLIFRNNTDKAIMIDTQYTGKSITVRIFGDNDGRTVVGDHAGGKTSIHVDSAGGPNALWVDAHVSDRYSVTGPGGPRYKANPNLALDQQVQTQKPRDGWSVSITRTSTRGGEQVVEETEWVARYLPQFEVIEVNPCYFQGEGACDPPTTTTMPPTGSTTTTGG
ncbi:MAG: VanW family protein, partial [Actinomycetota bacterium]|nr:VanW family protein [Actinomycetota bacterium]